jgi:hypothetical protein
VSKNASVVIKLVQSSSASTQNISRKAVGKKSLTLRGYIDLKYAMAGISSDLIRIPKFESNRKIRDRQHIACLRNIYLLANELALQGHHKRDLATGEEVVVS